MIRGLESDMRICLWLVMAAALAGGCAQNEPATWQWSVADGCKPGVGLRLVVGREGTTGKLFILDPNKPHDFWAAGQAVELAGLKADAAAMTFDTTLVSGGKTVTNHWALKLERPLTGSLGAVVKGSLSEAAPGSAPMDIQLTRVR
jgi:hypothetical protein